jgi:hypothetical protein
MTMEYQYVTLNAPTDDELNEWGKKGYRPILQIPLNADGTSIAVTLMVEPGVRSRLNDIEAELKVLKTAIAFVLTQHGVDLVGMVAAAVENERNSASA